MKIAIEVLGKFCLWGFLGLLGFMAIPLALAVLFAIVVFFVVVWAILEHTYTVIAFVLLILNHYYGWVDFIN